MLEKTVKAAVRKRLKEIGAYQFWPVQTVFGTVTLDCLGIYRGLGFAIETKAPGKKPTKMQEFSIEQIKNAGGLVFVIDSVEAARELFADHSSSDPADTRPML